MFLWHVSSSKTKAKDLYLSLVIQLDEVKIVVSKMTLQLKHIRSKTQL